MVVHRKKIHPQAKPIQRAGGFRIAFLKIHPHTKLSERRGGY